MKFRYTIMYVEDVEKTLEFYVKAFGLQKKMIHESCDYGELDTGSTKLSFSSFKLMKSLGKTVVPVSDHASSFEIAFECNDVEGAYKKAVSAGAKSVQDVEEMPWGQTTAYVKDINGFLVEICSPVTV